VLMRETLFSFSRIGNVSYRNRENFSSQNFKSEYIFTMFLRGKEIVWEESKKNLTGQLEQPAAAIHLSPILVCFSILQVGFRVTSILFLRTKEERKKPANINCNSFKIFIKPTIH
jgi:hypothetical protein